MATWIVPSGRYQRETRMVEGREQTLVVPGTYEPLRKSYSLRGLLLEESAAAAPGVSRPVNFVIPSGSGQAAVTMPLMAPLADVLGISRQTAVLALQFGDGLSNTLVPTSGILMAMLALAQVPYGRWLTYVLPVFCQVLTLAAVFLVVAVLVGYS